MNKRIAKIVKNWVDTKPQLPSIPIDKLPHEIFPEIMLWEVGDYLSKRGEHDMKMYKFISVNQDGTVFVGITNWPSFDRHHESKDRIAQVSIGECMKIYTNDRLECNRRTQEKNVEEQKLKDLKQYIEDSSSYCDMLAIARELKEN